MVKRLETENFTILRNVDVTFSPDLNVIIGENGAGKTHVIKLLYSVLAASVASARPKTSLGRLIADKLINVFRPDQLGRLSTRTQGRTGTTVSVGFSNRQNDITFQFATNSKSDVRMLKSGNPLSEAEQPLFFPAKELLSIFPNFLSLYEEYHLPYDETYYDTMRLLGLPYARGPRNSDFQKVLGLVEESIGGTIRLDPNGRSFHLILHGNDPKKGKMEIDLVAEGWRKLGMLTQVVLNNALRNQGVLFWDEPEANLNPMLIKVLAKVLFWIATESKIQVFLTTHSLFLLRELEFLSMSSRKKEAIRFVGIRADGQIDQGHSSTALTVLPSLDEEIDQSNRILRMGSSR